ncbi:MAG: nucleotide exchange factor GrpE [Oxalobacteraceae bacterium]|nr:nucleotide exchange factor GrpE [Oxalobacteraceae bacterium]
MTQGEQRPNPEESHSAPVAGSEPSQAEVAAGPQVEGLETSDSLTAQLLEAQNKLTEMQDAYLRAKAEADNTRRRAQEDIAKAHKFAIESFAESLLPVKDSLEMALKVETPSIESLKEGVDMTLKQLVAAFDKHRLVEVNPQAGEKLDPMKHQAISMVPAEQEANTIVAVLQKGYMISDRLLRPALVTVSQST